MRLAPIWYGWTLAAAVAACAAPFSKAQDQLSLLGDMVLDNTALLMPTASTYGRAINGVEFQGEALFTYNGYQYATWYHDSGSEENVYVARRNLSGSTWELRDTGSVLTNGDATAWDAHNVISMGIASDGRLHYSWDMHNNTLRYRTTTGDVANSPGSVNWNTFTLNPERTALNSGGPAINDVTYPQFVTHPTTGDMVLNYRTGSSGQGNSYLATYSMATGLWNTPHVFIDGLTPINYDDDFGSASTNRNAYVNGFNIDGTGRMHVTWTWRESATGSSNHDIMYAYSDDGGDTWRNNAGTVVGTLASPMNMNSPGIIVVPKDRGNTLMNQQTQTVDGDGRVHVVMWHKTDAAAPVTGFTTAPAAYFHYYRDPTSGVWTRTELPTSRAVGSRPDMAYDNDGNLYVAYVSPGPGDGVGVLNYYTEGDLIVATASKASAYSDWTIVNTDTRDFSGEPHIDQTRLLQSGVISVVMQENNDAVTTRTGTPLHVLEYSKLAKSLVWAGDHAPTWDTGVGSDWDSDGNNTGDAVFASGNRVTFDDGATAFNVNIARPVAPASTTFRNTVAKSYTVTGAAIEGAGGLTVMGGGMVTLANGANSYAGPTSVTSGKLLLSGGATITTSPTINVAPGAALDVTSTSSGSMTLNNQTLVIDGGVLGNVVATNNSTVQVNSVNSMDGNLTVQSGSLAMGSGRVNGNLVATAGTVRVGGVGIPTTTLPLTTAVDDFSAGGLGEYTRTRINDSAVAEQNVFFTEGASGLTASYTGTTSQPEQVVLLRNDRSLAVGEMVMVDVSMSTTSTQMDFGLAVSSVNNPTSASAGDTDTRDTFDWASVSIRPSANEIRVNKSINGVVTTATGNITGVAETSVSKLLIERTSSTTFTVGYIDSGAVRHDSTPISFTGGNVGASIGFYADLRAVGGNLGTFDNLRIVEPNHLVPLPQTLTVDGDYTQSSGATLQLEIYSPNALDLLDVSGNITAGGTLAVALDANAPAPQAGDEFDLMDFSSFTGVFDFVVLPALGSGLVWDNSLLLTQGVMKVIAGLSGDFNDDGKVDATDYIVWRRSSGLIGAGLAADGNADLHVDDTDYSIWKANFGRTLSGSGEGIASAVPEPGTIMLLGTVICGSLLRRTKRRLQRN